MTNTKTNKAKYERHFTGRGNAGLRATIRSVVEGHRCGPANAAAVLGLGKRIALTASGQATLAKVAADYRAVSKTKTTCDCADCYEVNLAGVRARLGQ